MRFCPATRVEFAIWPLALDVEPRLRLGAIWQSWMRRLAIRHLRRELSSLPDWLLYDVGIERTHIHSLAIEIVDGCKQARFAAEEWR